MSMYTLDISKRLAKHNRQKSLCHSLICTGVFCVSIILTLLCIYRIYTLLHFAKKRVNVNNSLQR